MIKVGSFLAGLTVSHATALKPMPASVKQFYRIEELLVHDSTLPDYDIVNRRSLV